MISRENLTHQLIKICGQDSVLTEHDERLVYECDAYPLARAVPDVVVLPNSTEMTARVLRLLWEHDVPFVPRGAGTSLAGGCLTGAGAVCIGLARMNRICHIDPIQRFAHVQAGVVTQHISDAARKYDLAYMPDPSSQTTCTIGGNVANNAGGPHTLKYGVTGQHIRGLTVVLPHGEILAVGSAAEHHHGFDLKHAFIGSEGTLGIVTEVIVGLCRRSPACRTVLAIFDRLLDAGAAVSAILARGYLPAALEIMDREILSIVEQAYNLGFPTDAGAILIIELDGVEAGLDRQMDNISEICRSHQVRTLKFASSLQERDLLWKARKSAFGALGRLTSNCITQDGVVPRSKLTDILKFIEHIAQKYDLRIANNFHAGDGNIHPNFLFDIRDLDQVRRVHDASAAILAECVRLGGSISGEHGIGVEKIDMLSMMYSKEDLAAQKRLRTVFDPRQRANPNKVFAGSD